jgi:5-methylcytosine-specific restriction endonuclease McrA
MSRALILNASFEPLCVVSTRRALVLVLSDKAELLHATDRQFHSERVTFPEPSVVRLTHYVRVPYQARVALNRRAVFARDNHRCQYCGSNAESIDHVIPKSRGGTHTWENVVAACRLCNTRKEDRMLGETSFVLRRQPVAPRERLWVIVAAGTPRPDWEPYLSAVGGAATPLSA